jgi:hypothetical protein
MSSLDLFVLQRLFLEREKLVFTTMNKFKRHGGSLLLGFCWVPKRDTNQLLNRLEELHESDPSNI